MAENENQKGADRADRIIESPKRRGFDMSQLAGDRFPPPAWHFDKIAEEMACPEPKDRMMGVVKRMGSQTVPDFSGIDWDTSLASYGDIEYPTYYQQPFHSVPGGYLSEAAAVGDRGAMEAIYEEWHPRRSLGLREEITKLIPTDARTIIDLGGGTGDMGSTVAAALPEADVLTLDASPFMLIAGEVQNGGIDNHRLQQGFAEATGLAEGSVDVALITLVFHECPNTIKRSILDEVLRVLRPGGTLVLSDTPTDDLHGFRGFYEPYKKEWLHFDAEATLAEAGFKGMERFEVAPPLWSVTARRPE
ncbi:MAG: class I SAM-dependent methyltransferase [Myxococcota bacterium]